jgi:hypothetical protein
MKSIVFIIALLFSSIGTSQDSIKIKVETPKIVTKLQLGKLMHFDGVDVKFVKVVTDSRCPKGVSCVWAGEAKVLIAIYKGNKEVEQKEIVFNTANQYAGALANIFASETLNVTGYTLSPYPEYGKEIKNDEYYIQLDVKKLE